MDNRLFNVNGTGEDFLLRTLELAFIQTGNNTACSAWRQSKTHGLILLRWISDSGSKTKPATVLPGDLSAQECIPMINAWLKGDFAKKVELSEWCGDMDHDGHNSGGFQVYVEGWGHVDDEFAAICGIKPAFAWHGK